MRLCGVRTRGPGAEGIVGPVLLLLELERGLLVLFSAKRVGQKMMVVRGVAGEERMVVGIKGGQRGEGVEMELRGRMMVVGEMVSEVKMGVLEAVDDGEGDDGHDADIGRRERVE
jgi:hypothetical protein